MGKNITLLDIPDEIHTKYLEFRTIIKKKYKCSSMEYTARLLADAVDEFMKDPDENIKKLVR